VPAFLAEILGQVRAIWGKLDAGQRLTAGLVVLATVVGLSAVVWFAGRPDYQVVLSTEDPKTYADATGALTQAGITFREENHSILVESGRVKEAQGKLFKAGLLSDRPAETDTNALANLTLDTHAKEYQLQRASWRNAEASVRQIAGVMSVTVTASKPKKGPFAAFDKQTQPRAFAVVEIRPGASFETIARAVASAVAAAVGLPEEYVTVTDAKTARRFQVDPDNASGLDASAFEADERRRSAELTDRAQGILDPLYPNQARVVVTAQLDPNWSTSVEKILSDKPLTKEDRTDKKDTREAGPGSGDASLGTPAASGAQANSNSQKNETRSKTYYDPAIGEKRSGKVAPEIKRLSVALVIDEVLKLDQKKLDDITKLVKQAIGWDDARDGQGFALHVEKFAQVPVDAIAGGVPGALDLAKQWGPTVGQVLAVGCVLLFLRSLIKKTRLKKGGDAAPAPLTKEQKETLTPVEQARRMRLEVERAIAEDPATISRLLESWLEEQRA
jgi:flagellar biosynthesis/type III secretory pathway M-ring protein FliF/YscJ